jgi:hypothetical protein
MPRCGQSKWSGARAAGYCAATVVNALLIGFGVVLLAVSWLCWSGRWRGWTDLAALPLAPVTAAPAVGLLFIAMGAGEFLPAVARGVLNAVTFAALVVGSVIWVWDPKWFGPAWYRDRDQ